MPSVSEFRSEYDLPESLRELVRPIDDTTDLGGALRVAGDGAVALAQGSAAAGLVVARKGVEVSKELAARARRAREEASPLIKAATEKALADKGAVEKTTSTPRGRRKALFIAGVLGAVVLGGVAFYRSRRPSFPPVAPEPPRLQPVVTDNEPTGN
ncbi:MAG TPA: hypothetical protein VFN32_06960 [Rhodococcus sp. (in: high G+C Gram-positive bacteria)]|nr:hypothetical protein [Rhodococcus sp. (in: high G+C Gram-positive bacteria)]